MSRKQLTAPQRRVLEEVGRHRNGLHLGPDARSWAPVRRLIRRGLLVKVDHPHRHSMYALRQSQEPGQ